MSLDGKVFFITGAARGIGAAVAAEAANRGARIALTGIEPDELEARAAELGEGHIHVEADVTEIDSMRAAVETTVAELGGIDMVLANAGIASYGSVEKGDPEAFLRTIEINLNGVYRTVHLTLPHVLERRGWIGIIGSIASYAPLPGAASYSASKAGVELFTRALRAEVGWRGVCAASIHPSWIDTDLVREASADLESFREIRSKLPWPAKATTSVDECARLIVDGVESRQDRIFIPKSARMLFWVRNLINSRFGERLIARDAPEIVPKMDAEVAAMGRATSARTAEINELEKTAG
ncbi:MAG: SDR family oxidoreductase [Solirubrobacterales bacterium]|jgi:NAD(P)-dependent dehydrogenase (short-subunit alcohol dehydrogenase family)